MSKARDPMKSHFCITIWKHENKILTDELDKNSYYDFSIIFDKIIEISRMCRAHYICWSVEDSRLKSVERSPGDPSVPAGFLGELTTTSSSELPKTSKATPETSRDDSKGGVHIHVYVELNRTIRWSTITNKFQKNGFEGTHVEVRKGWRETCREYHMGIKNYAPKIDGIISGEWGKWREDLGTSYSKEDYFELAANMIIHGYNPSQVALRFPTWYIRHGYGVERLWNSLNRDDQWHS